MPWRRLTISTGIQNYDDVCSWAYSIIRYKNYPHVFQFDLSKEFAPTSPAGGAGALGANVTAIMNTGT